MAEPVKKSSEGASVDMHSFGLFTDYSNWNLGMLWLVGDVTSEVVTLYQKGKINETVARDALKQLVVTAPDNTQWAMGSTSKRWYRRLPQGKWKIAETPPTDAESLSELSKVAVTSALMMLGLDPSTVEFENSQYTTNRNEEETSGSLLDDLLDENNIEDFTGGYGDLE